MTREGDEAEYKLLPGGLTNGIKTKTEPGESLKREVRSSATENLLPVH